MPRIPFTDLASSPEFKALPPEDQQVVATGYWDDVAAERPEQAEFYQGLRDSSKALLDTKAKRNDAPPVLRRFLDAQVQDLAFDLSLGDEMAQGRMTQEGYTEALKVRDTERAQRQAQLDKTRDLFSDDPKKQQALALRLEGLEQTAITGGVFGSTPLMQRVFGTADASKDAYAALREQTAKDYGLEPDEVDALVKPRLGMLDKPVSADPIGNPFIQPEILAQGPDAVKDAILKSELPWSEKKRLTEKDDLAERMDGYYKATVEGVQKNHPELYAILDLDQVQGDPKAAFSLIQASLNKGGFGKFAGGFTADTLSTAEQVAPMVAVDPVLNRRRPLPTVEGSPDLAAERRQEVKDTVAVSRRAQESINQLSQEFYKNQGQLWGVDASAYGSGAGSVLTAVGAGILTGGASIPVSSARVATMGPTALRMLNGANSVMRASPSIGLAMAKTGTSTYENAIKAGLSEEEAGELATLAGATEGVITGVFSLVGAGGVEAVGEQLLGTAARQAVRESAKSGFRTFGEKMLKGIASEQFEEGMIAAFDAATVQARINPDMTVEDFLNTMRETALVTFAVSGPTIGVGSLRETLAEKATYQKTDDELELEADLNLADAVTTQPGEADIPPAGQGPANAAPNGGAVAPGAPTPVAPGGTQPVAGPEPVATEAVPGVQPGVAADPVLVPADAGVDVQETPVGERQTELPVANEEQTDTVVGEPAAALAAELPSEGTAQREGQGPQEVAQNLVSSETPEDTKPHAAMLDEQGVPKRLFHGKAAPFKNSEFQIKPNQLTNLSGLGPAWFSTSRNQAERFVGETPEGPGEVVEPTRIDIRNPLVLRGNPESVAAVRENRKILDLMLKIGQVSNESISDEDFEILKQYLLERGVMSIKNKRTVDLQPWTGKVLVGDEAARVARKESSDLMQGTHPEADPFGQLKRLLKEAEITLSASGIDTQGMTEGEMLRRALELEGKDGIVLLGTMADTKVDDEPSDWVIPFRPDQLVFDTPAPATPAAETPAVEEALAETFREPEPTNWSEVFEVLNDRDPATKQVDTESPKFKELVDELKNNRVAEAAGKLEQRKADIAEMRAEAKAAREAREKEFRKEQKAIKDRRKAKQAEKPLDRQRRRILELTKDPVTGKSVSPDYEAGLLEWLRARGYTGGLVKNDLRTMMGEKGARSTPKEDALRQMYFAQTPEVQEVLQSYLNMSQKGKEQHPELQAFENTPIGSAILQEKLKSRSWFRRNKVNPPPAYEKLKKHGRIRAHLASSIFNDNGVLPEDISSGFESGSYYGGTSLTVSEEDVVQAIIDLDNGMIATEEDADAQAEKDFQEFEKQQQEQEDREIAFAEQQLQALAGDAQTVDLREVRDGDTFTLGGVDYTATGVEADQRGQTQSFTLRGDGPLTGTEVTEDFFAESVTPTEGSLAHVDPAEIEAIRIAQEFPEDFEDVAEPAPTATEPEAAPTAGPVPYSPEALKETFDVSDEQAVVMDALVQAMGLDTSRIQLQRGGVPSDAAMRQEMDARDAEYLVAVERGDMETAQRMVDEAARAAGYEAETYVHETTSKEAFTEFKVGGPRLRPGQELTTGDIWGEKLSGHAIWFRPQQGESLTAHQKGAKREITAKLRLRSPLMEDRDGIELYGGFSEDFPQIVQPSDTARLKELGRDSVVYTDKGEILEILIFEPSQAKSADPVTRDADGKVIPLSQRFNPESPSILFQSAEIDPRIKWDPREGLGSVPYNQDVNYRGFVMPMTAAAFRKLVPPGVSGPATKDYVKKHLGEGGSLGQPFLKVDFDNETGQWKVRDHEGRSRVDAISEIYGPDTVIPVHFFPSGELRGRDITPEMKRAPVIPQNGGSPTIPSLLFQGPKGSFEQLPETGDILLRGLSSPDVSTGVHEIAHAARRTILNRDTPAEARAGITDADIAVAEEWAGAKDGVWTRAAEEKFARGWERYLRDGKSPVAALQGVFDKMAAWLRSIYVTVAGSPIDVEISPEMRAVFDKLVSRTLPQPKAAPTPAPQPQATTPPPPVEPTPAPVAELEDPDVVGMQNAATDRRRQRAGLPPRFAPARLSNQAAWDEAMRRINKDPAAGRDLVEDLRKSPRSIDPVETAMFTHELLVREQRLDEALDKYNSKPDPDNETAMKEASAAVAEAILTAERIGTIEGRALQARKILVHQDFSLGRLVAKATAANGGKELSADQTKEVAELHKQMQELQTQLAAAQEQLAKEQAERVHVTVVADYKKGLRETKKRGEKAPSWIDRQAEEARARILARKREGRLNSLPVDELLDHAIVGVSYLKNGLVSIGEFTTQLVKDFGNKILPFRHDIFAKSQELYGAAAPSSKVKSREDVLEDIDPEAPLNDKAIFQLVRHYINEGVDGFEPVMQAVLNDLREFYPDLTLREVHDAYSKYGQTRVPSQEEDLKLAREYKELSRLQSQLEDAQRGLAPLKTGLQREQATQRVRDLTKAVKDTMRKLNIRPTTADGQLRSSFDAIKTRLRNEYEDLDTAIRKGEARKERSPQTFTPAEEAELKALRQRRDDRKADYEAIFKKKGLTDEQRIERAERLLDRRIAEERDMLEKGILKRNREMLMGPFSPALKSRKETLDKLKAERRELQKAARPKTPELEQKYKRDLASLERRIKEEEKLLAEGLTARQRDFKMGRWTPEMAAMQARLDGLRDARRELAESRKPEKDEAAAAYERATKAIEASIQRYKDILAGVAKTDPGKKFTVDAEMAALLDQRDALRDAAAALRAMDPARIDKKKQAVLKALDKSITEITRKIQDGDLSTKGRTDFFANDPDVAKLRAARDLLNKTLEAMRKDALPKRSPEEIRNSRDQKLIESKIAKLEDRLARGDYAKRPKLPPPNYTGRDALLKEKKRLESEFNTKLLELELANRSLPKKIFDNTVDVVFGVSRAMLTSFDAGAFGRQAGLVNFMRPGLAVKNFPANFAFTEKAATRYETAMESHPDWARAQAAGLALTSWRPGSSLTDMEEVYRSRIAKKIPGVAASERAYVTYLNQVRFTYFNALMNTLPVAHQTEENMKFLARHVNMMTGRGKMSQKMEAGAAGLAALFFSPKYWWSRLQILGNLVYIPLDAMTGFNLGAKETRIARQIVAIEYARLGAMLGLVYSLFAFAKHAFDWEDEEFTIGTDPRSSDFGKLRLGNTRIDFMAGLLQNVVFISRMVTGEKTTGSGASVPISGNIERKFGQNRFTETIRLLRTKLSPAAGSIVNFLDEQDVVGNKFNWETEIVGSYIPMSVAETYSSMRELGIAPGAAAGLLGFIGIGASTYGGEEDYVIEQDIMTGVFGIDQARYEKEVKEKGWVIPKSKGLPTF